MSLLKIQSSIPPIIHQIVGLNTTPLIKKCLESWHQLEEIGFEIRIWNDSKIESFILSNHKFALEAFVSARNYAEAADIARYLIIHTYGGYYTDWDVELLDKDKFLKLSLKYNRGYMLCDPNNNSLASEFFCAEEKDLFLLELTKDIVQIYENNERDKLVTPEYSGPYRMRDSLLLHPNTVMSSIPIKEVFAYDYLEIRNPPPRLVTQPLIHYWLHSWMKI